MFTSGFAQDDSVLKGPRITPATPVRFGDRSLESTIRTDERNTFVAFGESLRAVDIEPDPGSSNPYRVGADRLVENRKYTIRVLAEDAPVNASERERNTLYIGRKGTDIQGVIRIYLPDQGRDGNGQ